MQKNTIKIFIFRVFANTIIGLLMMLIPFLVLYFNLLHEEFLGFFQFAFKPFLKQCFEYSLLCTSLLIEYILWLDFKNNVTSSDKEMLEFLQNLTFSNWIRLIVGKLAGYVAIFCVTFCYLCCFILLVTIVMNLRG